MYLCACVYYVRLLVYPQNSSLSSECCITKLGKGTQWVAEMIVRYIYLFIFDLVNKKIIWKLLPANL